ncbi:hypothetical protein G6M02_14085 [Agrobacterium rhizogenes]|nr:hypothetical protein [Rhizobium rhizogenes]
MAEVLNAPHKITDCCAGITAVSSKDRFYWFEFLLSGYYGGFSTHRTHISIPPVRRFSLSNCQSVSAAQRIPHLIPDAFRPARGFPLDVFSIIGYDSPQHLFYKCSHFTKESSGTLESVDEEDFDRHGDALWQTSATKKGITVTSITIFDYIPKFFFT